MTTAQTYAGRAAMDKVAAKTAAADAAEQRRQARALGDLQIKQAADKAKEQRRRADAADKAKRREQRQERRRAALVRAGALATSPLPWVLAVILASVVVAWPGQVAAVRKLEMNHYLALAVPLFTELPTWAMAWMRRQAIDAGRPGGVYAWMTWAFAGVAAGLNAWSASSERLAAVMALSSLVGVIVWEIYMISQSAKASGRSAAEVRLRIARRCRHPRVAMRAGWLTAATGQSAASAWEAAWRMRHGADPGVTERVLRRQADRAAAVADAAQALRAVTVAQTPTYWSVDARGLTVTGPKPPAPEPEQAPRAVASAPKKQLVTSRKPPARTAPQATAQDPARGQSRAARTAAAHTARAATPEQSAKEQETAREWVRAEVAAGREPGWRDLAAHLAQTTGTARGETWCRTRLREAQPETAAA